MVGPAIENLCDSSNIPDVVYVTYSHNKNCEKLATLDDLPNRFVENMDNALIFDSPHA